LKNTYAHIIDFVNKHTTDQLHSQMFVHKQPTLVDYSTALEDMAKRFRIDNPSSTHELSTTILVPQPTTHESMRDPNATMDIDDPDQGSIQTAGVSSSSSSSSFTSSSTNPVPTPRHEIFDYSAPPVVTPPKVTISFEE
jgi:hypothetical protein